MIAHAVKKKNYPSPNSNTGHRLLLSESLTVTLPPQNSFALSDIISLFVRLSPFKKFQRFLGGFFLFFLLFNRQPFIFLVLSRTYLTHSSKLTTYLSSRLGRLCCGISPSGEGLLDLQLLAFISIRRIACGRCATT